MVAHVCATEACSQDEARTQIRLALADGAIEPLCWSPEPASPPNSGASRFPGNPPPHRDDHWRFVDLDWEHSRVFDTFARANNKALRKLYREADHGPTEPPPPRKSSWRQLLLDRAACESLWPKNEPRRKTAVAASGFLTTDVRTRTEAGMPKNVPESLRDAMAWHNRPSADPAELRRLAEALAELREKVRVAVRAQQPPLAPADVVEEKCRQAGEDIKGELLAWLARGRIAAFIDTNFGLERLPDSSFWLHADGGAILQGERALVQGVAPSDRQNGVAGVVNVCIAAFRVFADTYLAERGFAEREASKAMVTEESFAARLGWIPLDRAVEIIRKVEGDTAWQQVVTAIRLKELPARCLADGMTRDFEPHWLDFLAWDYVPENGAVLWFDRERAWRKAFRPADRAAVPIPDRAEKITVSITRCTEIWATCIWPAFRSTAMLVSETVSAAPADNDSIPTGMPGRPSKGKHLIDDEFGRRCVAGEALPTLGEEANALLAWYIETHPQNQRPKSKTIENNIRTAHRRWLVLQAQTATRTAKHPITVVRHDGQ